MARINQFEALLDDLHREAVAKGYADTKAGQSTLKKPLTVREVMAKAGLDADEVKPFMGKRPMNPAALRDMNDASVPTALRNEALKQAIVAHAATHDNLNSPISGPMLHRVLQMAKAGRLTDDQARRTVEHHSKGLALPTDVMRAISSER
ncbi:hypothetical protein PQR64_33850 [Paraburkholderia phytofirmans]|uniref:hypothetical protein n=1 Tax=Paraburkholderia phytofirmans TaxID=261302 RepID=UPI0038BAC31B